MMNCRIIISFILVSVSFTQVSYAQSKAERKILEQLKTDIEYLASDSLEGRSTGTRGEKLAGSARW